MLRNKNNFYLSSLVCLFFLLLLVESASAQIGRHASWKSTVKNSGLYLTAGQATGEANELVYCQTSSGCTTDYKLSHLIWEIKDVTMLMAGFTRSINDLTLNIEGKFRVTEGNGDMDDYDWQYTNTGWSDWSHHDDTSVTEASVWDINLDFRFYTSVNTNLAMVLGYKSETWGWESRGGSYIYSDTDISGFRDLSGDFTAGELAISYTQEFSMPYVGIKLNTSLANLKFHARVIYSNMVGVSALDLHHMRDLTFEDNFADGEMAAYDVSLTYQLATGLGLIARFDAQEYQEVRGDTTYRVSSTGADAGSCTNCAGADNSNSTWSLGLSYEY